MRFYSQIQRSYYYEGKEILFLVGFLVYIRLRQFG